MKKISLAYFGSPDFSARFLEKLITDTSMYRYIEVKLVVAQPDKPVGRKQIITPTPVKQIVKQYSESEDTKFSCACLPAGRVCCFPSKNFSIELTNLDLALVYAYGDFIPKKILNLPKYGFWNIHPSLLPKYRGTSPIATPLINGDKTTGVTIIKMDEEIDHGPIIAQENLTIEDTDYRPDLERKLTDLGFEMFKKLILTNLNELQLTAQADEFATYTKKLSKQDGFIEFEKIKSLFLPTTNYQLLTTSYNLFRGLYPWPGLWTLIKINGVEKRLKITGMSIATNHQPLVTKVQLEGKNEVDFETFNQAYKIV